MKRLSIFSICLITIVPLFAQKGYDIGIQLKPYRHTWVYLGYYYGKSRALADSTLLDDSSAGHFRGKEALKGGIYFIVSPSRQILFEVLIDKDQYFSVSADTTGLPFGVRFSGSPENKQFQDYSSFAANTGKKIGMLAAQLGDARSRKDSLLIDVHTRLLTARLQKYRDSISKKNPESFLSALFNAMNEPKIPPASKQPGGKYDSNFVYHYFKNHYWDGISFVDDRLVRTPFFEPRLDKYFQNLVSPTADSLIKETDQMLLQSRSAKEMYQYLMVHFVQQYINPVYMGQDAVFVHLFEKYINAGKAEFFTPQYKDFATKRAYSLMANLIGQPAPQLDMADTADKPLPLYTLKGAFTVICFWDPTCSHCKEVVPKVDSIFQAKWRSDGVQLYGVKVDGTKEEWLKFIKEHHLTGWNHVYQQKVKEEEESREKRAGYRQLYDVYQTPLLYLLDNDKRIIAKKLSYLQIDEVIRAKMQHSNKL